MTVGERIRQRRRELDMSQEELAHKLGYKSKSSINKIELGVYDLKQSKLEEIAKALDTTPAYIMGWDEDISEEAQDRLSETLSHIYNEEISHLLKGYEEQSKELSDALIEVTDEMNQTTTFIKEFEKLSQINKDNIMAIMKALGSSTESKKKEA